MISIAKTALAAAFSFGIVAGASATTISNGPATGFEAGFGVQDAPLAGQLFRTPNATETRLTSFTLTLGPEGSSNLPVGPITVNAFIAEWVAPDASQPQIGAPGLPPIWSSSDLLVDLDALALGNLQPLTFNLSLSLTAGATYLAYLSLENNFADDNTLGTIGFAFVDDVDPLNPGLPLALVFSDTVNWYPISELDALFSATFAEEGTPSAVPVPAALALFGVGLAGLTMVRRRKAA